jgi:O-antigen/teichoic acid export membrane protein
MSTGSEKVLSHGKIYLVGNILQRCVSFVMLPIYTRFLSPTDYGTIELLSMVLDFTGIILGLRIGQSIFRFYAAFEGEKDKAEVITTAIYLIFLLNALGFLLLFLIKDYISLAVFGDISQRDNIVLFSVTLLMQSFTEIPMTYVRAQQRPWLFISFSVIKLVLQLSLNIIFIVMLGMRVEGVIYSAIISSAVMAFILGCYVIVNCGLYFSLSKARKILFFSFPLMLTGLFSFYLTFGDRYFLRNYFNVDEVGIYSLAYKFGFLLMFLVVNPFSAVWDSEKYNIVKTDNAKKTINDIFIYYSATVLLVCVGISLFVEDVLHVMAAPPFWKAASIVPVILAAYLTNAWCEFVSLGILLKDKTMELTYGTLVAGLVITPGYLYLIPKFGGKGAAWATFFAFGARALWVYFRARRLYDLGITWRSSWLLVVLWAGVYGLSQIDLELSLLPSLLFKSMLFGCVLVAVLFAPVLPTEVRQQLRQAIMQPKKLFSVH